MKYHCLCILCAGWLATGGSALADIIWSGDQYLRTYHDVAAIDINLDGTDDFTFNQVIDEWEYENILIEPAGGQVVTEKISAPFAGDGYPLAAGTVIAADLNNPGIVWESTEAILFLHGTEMGNPNYGGHFRHTDGYLGVSFNVSGATHYGWIEMSHDRDRPEPNNNSLMVHGWAWETEADTAIIAGAIPEPSSGILTMIGTLSLLQLARSRRRRKQGCTPMLRCRSPKSSEEPKEW